MKKSVFSILMVCVLIISLSLSTLAHSGRTDSNGGHRDNKNKSGLGSYHYHCGGYPAHLHKNGVCPYKSGGSSSSSSSNTSKPKKVYATSITAKSVPSKMNAGETAMLEASVYPSNAEDKTITWESSNTGVLRVSSIGRLTAVSVGTATITAKTERGTSKKFKITVNEVLAKNIRVTNGDTEILLGESQTLECKFSPENTTDKTVTWKSSDESIISVSASGEIIANNLGKATITVMHKNLTDNIEIEVMPIDAESVEIVLPDEIEKNNDGTPKMKKGSMIQLEAEFSPENTTYKEIEWTVNDEAVAGIDENGLLTANEDGKITVTATAKNGVREKIEIVVYSKEEDTVAIVVLIILSVIGAGGLGWYYRGKRKEESKV